MILINDSSESLKIRYIDWFITVPLLVYVISAYNTTPFWVLALSATLMLLFGFLSVLIPE
jgi:bacteriorhodopsin